MKWAGFITGFLCMLLASSAPVYAASDTLQAKIQGNNPLKPILTLTNTGQNSCQIVRSSFGTISVTQVKQAGQIITPKTLDVASDDSFDATMASQLQTLKAGESVDIPLRVSQVGPDHVLEAVTWSPGTGAFGTQYPVQADKPLDIILTYDAPITVTSGAPLCGVAYSNLSSATTLASSPLFRAGVVALAVAIVLIIAALLFLWIKRHRQHAKVAILLLAIGLSFATVWRAPSVSADYDVPSSAATQFNDCMNIFNQHRDITGPILDALSHAHVAIDPNNTHTNDTARYGPNSFRIYWDPNSIYNYPGHYEDQPPVTSYPCPRLFHEMYHAYDMLNGTFSRDPCNGSNIDTKEVMATRAENQLRAAVGLAQRTHYGTDPIPPGNCTQQPQQQPCTNGHCGQSNADPHLTTIDGLKYDFQAVGEFVATRDTSDSNFEVQVRQTPFPGSRLVSVNSAIAMRVGTDRVEARLGDNSISLLVNGQSQPFQTAKLKGGGRITPLTSREVTITWPDKSAATIQAIGSYGLHLMLEPSATHMGKLEGLLGNFNDTTADDLKMRGTDTTIKPQPTFEQLYPKFADSWRIDGKSSLFTYSSGKTTASYTDKNFPDKPVDVQSLPNRAVAESVCKELGVTDPAILTDCTLDVALTGRPEFAQAASIAQVVSSGYGGRTWQVTIKDPGTTADVAFDGTAGQKVFIDVPISTIPDQCGVITLQDPKGNGLRGGCIIDKHGYIDGTVLPFTGTYHIILDPSESHTGTATINLITITDQTGTIVPDGKQVLATISRPGAVAQFTFDGKAGQKVFVSVPASTLPDQCGVIGIQAPNGDGLISGCIIDGTGFANTLQLPTTGTYTVYLDPVEHNVGQTAINLILPQDYTATMSVNGPSVTAKLNKPGSIAALNFTGHTGERVYVDVSNATLPDQCGGFYMQDPDGKGIANDCIIRHKGSLNDKGTLLQKTGIYTVFVDPPERNTGQFTVRIHN